MELGEEIKQPCRLCGYGKDEEIVTIMRYDGVIGREYGDKAVPIATCVVCGGTHSIKKEAK